MDGSVLQVPRTKDKTYLYTCNPSPIHHRSNKIDHTLKIVDFFIEYGQPNDFVIEPTFGTYEPDVYFTDRNNKICVELQLTPISNKKMQEKINQFVSEHGRKHTAKIFLLCSNHTYSNLKMPNGFQLVRRFLPKEIIL
jgi:hypothetical protein